MLHLRRDVCVIVWVLDFVRKQAKWAQNWEASEADVSDLHHESKTSSSVSRDGLHEKKSENPLSDSKLKFGLKSKSKSKSTKSDEKSGVEKHAPRADMRQSDDDQRDEAKGEEKDQKDHLTEKGREDSSAALGQWTGPK